MGSVVYERMLHGRFFAPRQLLLRCPDKLHPCNDAKPALPPSMAVGAAFERAWTYLQRVSGDGSNSCLGLQ